MSGLVYDVVPARDLWLVRLAGDSQSEAFGSKSEAVTRARHLAERHAAAVRILDVAGSVEQEYRPPARH